MSTKSGFAIINGLCTIGMLSGIGTCILAQVATPDLKGWEPTSLLALVCIACLSLAWYMVKTMNTRLDKLIDQMAKKPCLFSRHEVADKIEKE